MKLEQDFTISTTDKIFVINYDAVTPEQMKQINNFNNFHLSERQKMLVPFVEELRK